MTGAQLPSGQWHAEVRLLTKVTGVSGYPNEVEFKLRRDTVEVWHAEHCCAALACDLLRDWLAYPWGPLVVDEARFASSSDKAVTLSLPGVEEWTVDCGFLAQLRERV